jgi:hypothetical protein
VAEFSTCAQGCLSGEGGLQRSKTTVYLSVPRLFILSYLIENTKLIALI